jgi:1-acyl-sn-glycerol-3-phosphate acyltransferase
LTPPSSPARRSRLSSAARLALFGLWTAAIALAWLAASPFLSRRASIAWAGRCTRAFCRGVLRILGIVLDIRGTPPRAPFFLVSNHLGYLDVMVLGALAPCAFVAKSEVASWPVFGALARWSGTLFIDRLAGADVVRVNALAADRLRHGGALVLFPEGTSTDGSNLAPFRPSLLQAPVAGCHPVHYASLRYRAPEGAPPARSCMCWWGDMDFLPHFLGLFRWRGLSASVAFGPEPLRYPDRKSLAAALHRGVGESLERLGPADVRLADPGRPPAPMVREDGPHAGRGAAAA